MYFCMYVCLLICMSKNVRTCMYDKNTQHTQKDTHDAQYYIHLPQLLCAPFHPCNAQQLRYLRPALSDLPPATQTQQVAREWGGYGRRPINVCIYVCTYMCVYVCVSCCK